jgi:ferritin
LPYFAAWHILFASKNFEHERGKMDAKVLQLINDQINKEFYSAYLYLSFADYYEEEGLDGYANWYEIQAQEERDHALIFRNYLHDNGERVKLGPIAGPDMTFTSHIEPLEAGLEHEKYITQTINDIYAAAVEANDYRTQKFLGWFIDEQLEEENTASDMIDKMRLFGGDARSLYELNQEYAARTYTTPTPLAGN